MSPDGGTAGIVAIAVLIILAAAAVIVTAVQAHRRHKVRARAHHDNFVLQDFGPPDQYADYQPAGHLSPLDSGRHWSDGVPATPLAQKVMDAHLDVLALDHAVLTGTVTDLDVAYQKAGYSVTRLAQQILRELKQGEDPQ